MAGMKVLTAEDGYCLAVGDEESEYVEYGEPLLVELGGKKVLALVAEDPENPSGVMSLLGEWAYEVKGEIEGVEVDDAPDDEEDEDEDEDTVGGGDEDEDEDEEESEETHVA